MSGSDALSSLLERALSGSLEVSVVLTDSNKVKSLESEIDRLRAELKDVQTRLNRTEYLYRCEVLISMQICDYCRDNGFALPKRLRTAPGSFGEVP